jgi:PAS domain S-box-containing protein
MKPEHLKGLRECCQNEAAFEKMKQILLQIEAAQQQTERQTLDQNLLGKQVSQTVLATDRYEQQQTLERLILERTTNLLHTNQQLRQEIADRQWAENAIQEREQRFRALIENATDIIVVLDQNGIFRYSSPSATRVLGYPPEEVIGRSATEFVHPEDVELVMRVLQQAIAHSRVSQMPIEYRVRHRNASWCVFEAVATSLLDDPTIRGVVVNCHDITERKQVEEALRAANRRTANILESITDAFISLDGNWQFTYVNRRAGQLFQRSPQELLGRNLWQAIPEIVNSTFDRECRRALEQQVAVTFEEFYSPLKTWFEVRAFPSAEGLSIFFLDVTERKQAQAELLEMSTALGNAVEGIARLDIQGHYIALNRAYALSLGYQPEEMIGMSWEQSVYPDDLEIVQVAHRQMLVSGKAEVEVRALRKDGSTFYKQVVMVATYDWNDQMVGHHCFTKDITERKRAEEALRQQAERQQLMGTIAQRIRQSLNLEEILNTTVSEVRQLLKADRVIFFRIEPNGDGLVTAESVVPGLPCILGYHCQDERFKHHQENYRQGNNLVVHDAARRECTSPMSAQWQVRSFLVVPILHSDRLWGLLGTHQCSSPRHWEPVEIALLEQLATQVAIAIQQSELYEQIQSFAAGLERQVQERTAELQQALQFEAMLKRITDSVRDSLDEDQILQRAVQELALGLPVQGSDAAIHNTETGTATIRYEYICSPDLPPAQGSVVQMADYSDIFNQLSQGQDFQFCRVEPSPIRPTLIFSAVLACPILDNQEVIGNLWLFKPREETYTSREIRLVQQVANQCAIAIRQARLYQAAQAQVAALEQLNHLKDDFLSTVSHELRTPMSNMKMAIHMLRSGVSLDRQQRYLDILHSECLREIELINDLLDLQRLEAASYPLDLAPVDLKQVLLAVVEPFYSRACDRQQTLRINLPTLLPTLVTDRTALERILAELLNNACKYTHPQGEIALTATQLDIPGSNPDSTSQVLISVSNQAGIPPSELSRIFEKFYRIPNADPWKQGGTGLGLALIQRLVIQLGGTINASSEQDWTTFTITFNTAIEVN